jgi:hypothetical protein
MNTLKITRNLPVDESPFIKAGQIYTMKDEPDRFFIVVDLYDDKYSLIELSDGVAWDEITSDIENVFNNDDGFVLVKNATISLYIP